ncbi:MAG: 16S rRNA (cytidine(1402)-2'-O)-methyltransferase [Acidimicrobiales bacterium]|nr:16S rRNA (cytidine(1402)-2'-O)-methyltransferase [Acidimicrobiales bacterium]
MTGKLTLVGTPLGNLGDITDRARESLGAADLVLCEDTRRTGGLISKLGLPAPKMLVANEHTEHGVVDRMLTALAEGKNVVLATDAGMPAISDPGARLINAAVDAGFDIDVAPGPTALVVGLVLSGLPSDRFVFEGFLPRKGTERAKRLGEIGRETRTVILYEAPHRLVRTLEDLAGVCGQDRMAAAARELTKMHQDVQRGTLDSLHAHFFDVPPKGEFVLVIGPTTAEPKVRTDDDLVRLLRAELDDGASTRDAVSLVSTLTGESKRRVYDLANAL